ncbi:uncharacterized protein LOC127291252 [Leptopilina boulardi]|uniref:uncharacterized protein LOC127291252 n=1 Tax=Leptopilina boulardi TaxID=63433 RepID=UPI0021F65596|nr:uncharacterized protein LOC127291252 [Leptopilina boulardi]
MPHEKRIQRPNNLPPLPISDLKEFQCFEKFLDDGANFSATSYYLSSYPLPREEKGAISKLMPKVITNNLASEFNFDGHRYKQGFKSALKWQVIQGALSLRYENSDLTVAVVDMRSWLRNAKGRKQIPTADSKTKNQREKKRISTTPNNSKDQVV